MECTYRKHMDKSTRNVFSFCTTTGWWGNIEVLYSSGLTLRRNEKHTIGNAREKGLGKTEWMKLVKWKWVFPEAAGCWSVWLEWECNEVSGVSVRNERSSWNGKERKWKSYTASTWITNPVCFLFSAQLMGGGEILRLFGQRSGAKVLIFVRLLYIMSAYVLFYSLSILKFSSL